MGWLIKVGDKVILYGVEYVIKEIKGNDVLLVKCDDALNIKFINEKTLYAKLYEQQKQRADELEDMLNKEVEESYQMENRWRTEIKRADRAEKRWEKLKTLLDRLWKFGDADTHEVAYDLLIRIKQIEEDGE